MTALNTDAFTRIRVSIHTPTKGVTRDLGKKLLTPSVSIHTPTKGVTEIQHEVTSVDDVSIHTPTKGVTLPFSK